MSNIKRTQFRPAVRALALEPRLLFDGAGAVAVADNADNNHDNAAQPHEAQAPTPAADARPQEVLESGPASGVLLIIDASVADHQSLLADLPANVTVRVIGKDESGLSVIGEELAKGGNFDAIHIVSHGTPGSLTLGSDTIDKNSLSTHNAALQSWAGYLTADADILLYGCDIAQGEQGQVFIDELARITSADIAASTNATGNADKGGDWVLEANTGSIEATSLTLAGYGELLAAPTITDTAADEPFSAGENTPTVVGKNITITGTGSDNLSVTANTSKGTLSSNTFSGDAAAVQAWLASLQYSYTGTSETGDSDILSLSITNTSNHATTNFTRNISIAQENDAPTLTPPASGAGRLTVGEGGDVAFAAATGTGTAGDPVIQLNLGLTDLDNTSNQVIIKLTSLPGQGVLKLNGNELTIGSTFAVSDISNLKYHHNGSQVLNATSDTFQITVDDGAGGLLKLQTVTVDITPVNQAPTASGNIILIEGETGVALVGGNVPVLGSARGDLAIGDPDNSVHTVQITGLPANGTLKYNGALVTNGQTITNADLSKFTYDHDGSETTSDSFKLIVTDAGGGTGTDASSAETTINFVVLPNNDDPLLVNNTGVVFGPDASGTPPSNTETVTITPDMLKVTDSDSPDTQLTYTLTSIPAGGYLTFGATGKAMPVGYSFTQADLAAGNIKFVSLTGNDFTTDFKFTVKDGDQRLIPTQRNGGIYEADDTTLQINTFTIEYQGIAVGDGSGGSFPPFAEPNAPSGTLQLTAAQIAEGQTFEISPLELETTDTDNTPEQLVYRLLSLPSNGQILLNGTALSLLGSFTQKDINDGKVSFQHDGSEDFTASFTFDVSDGSSTTAVTTFNIDVKPQNDTPTAGNGEVIKLLEGANIVINAGGKTHITLADSDNDSSDKIDGYALDNALSFKVTALPTHGTLKLDGVNVTINQLISQADLDSGKLVYEHDASENYNDSFTIVPVDDKVVVSTSNNTDANANPPLDDPTNQASEGAPAVINISVNPLNDAPTFVSIAEPGYGNVPALKEGTEFTIGGASSYTVSPGYGFGSGPATAPADTVAHLVYQDSDNNSEQRQYRVTTATQYGVLTAGGRVLGVGSVFTQAELDSGVVKYKHGGGEQFDDKFAYVVSDGDFSSNQSTLNNGTAAVQGNAITPSEYRIKLERSNDKPTISTGFDVVNGLFVVDSSVTAQNLPTFTLGDKDLVDGVQAGETDFVQVSVGFLDGNDALYTNGVLQFESGYDPTNEGSGVTVTNAAGVNTLVFQGKLADVQAALTKIQARTNGVDADAANLKIKVTIDDRLRNASGVLSAGANGGTVNEDGSELNDTNNTSSIIIKVAASDLNDLPVVNMPASSIVVNEDVRTLLAGASAVTFTDLDAFDSTDNSIELSVANGKLYFSATGTTLPAGVTVTAGAIGSGSVTLQGTKAALDNALANLRYQSNLDYNGDDLLRVSVDDGGKNGQDGTDNSAGGSTTGTVDIAILPVNDAPTLTLPGADGYFPITGGSYEFSSANSNVIVIADAKDFTGAAGAQDGLDNNFSVTLNATLGANTNYGEITVAPSVGVVIVGSGTGTVTLTGSRTDINAALASGVRFVPAAGNLDGTVEFTVTVDDNNNGGTALTDPVTNTPGITGPETASQKLFLQPTAENDAPVFAELDNTPTYVQNGSAVVLDGNALLSDPELDLFGANGNWNGSVLTLQRDGGANAFDVFSTTGSGSTGVNISGTDLRIGSTVVGVVSNAAGTLQITFNASATAALVDQVLQGLTYKNTDSNPTDSVKINYLIDDQNPNNTGDAGLPIGGGQDQGTGGKLVGSGSITIGINRQIIATPDTETITERAGSGSVRSVSGDVTPGTSNSNDNGGTQDRDPDAGQTIVVQGVKAGTQSSVAAIGTAGVGSSISGLYGSLVINVDGTYTYSLDDTNPVVNALKPGETLTEVFSYAINDGQGVNQTTAFSTLTITVNGENDPPVATDNTNSVTEDSATPATGNVRTDGAADSDPDNVIAELSISGIRLGSEVAGGVMTTVNTATDSSNGTQVTGLYGTLTIGADGSYSYALDNSNPAVNALNTGETLSEVFSYTLRDPGNATDVAQLTITINGNTDGTPSIAPVDGNGGATTGEASVYEKGLTSPGDTSETTNGSIHVQAPDGIKSVTIGGTTISIADLNLIQAGSNSAISIDTGEGTLLITGITAITGPASAPIEANVTYTYTLKAPQNQPSATESTDTIALGVTDNSATPATATGTLTVQIIDDVPAAVVDTNTVTEGSTLTVVAADGVLKNDSSGADGWAAGGAVVGVVAGNSGTPTTGVGTEINGSYGKLTLNADGSYTYVTTANSITANAQDVFTYTVRDTDGDQVTTTLTIDVNNVTLPTTAISGSVNESGISGGSSAGTGHTISDASLQLPNGQTAIASSGNATHGSFVVKADGTYSYTLTTLSSGDTVSDNFTYTATDANGNTVINTVTITIVDDVPTAKPDVNAIIEDASSPATGNVFASTGASAGDQTDVPGADGASVTSIAFAGTTGIPGNGLAGAYGTLTLNADGSYSYALDNSHPAVQALGSGQTLSEVFTYTITDGDGDSSSTTLTITVNGENDAPITLASLPDKTDADSQTLIEITTANGFTDIDGDNLTFSATGLPAGLLIDPATGLITGTLDKHASQGGPGSNGIYTVTVKATDPDGTDVSQSFTYTVTNPVPTANNDTRVTKEDTPVSGNVLNGTDGDVADSDPDGDPLTVIQIEIEGSIYPVPADGSNTTVNIPGKGTLVIDKTGSYTFTPIADWHGSVPPITYTISDDDGGTDTAVLNISVTPVVDIAEDRTSTESATPVTINVLTNDSFENSDRVVTGVTQGTSGSVSFNPNGTITYTPGPSFFGTDTYTYTVTSGGVTETTTVTVDVWPVNPTPPQPSVPDTEDVTTSSLVDPRDSLSANLLLRSPVTLDTGPYFASERFDDVRRMQLPFHPIVYVNRQVQAAQLERAQDDPRNFSDPSAFTSGDQPLTSQTIELGADINLFVTHSVRDSQQQSLRLKNMVDGRYGRSDLSSEGVIPQTSLFREPTKSLSELLKERKKQQPATADTEATNSPKGESLAADDMPENTQQTQTVATEAATKTVRNGAPSFAEQLRSGAGRLPLAQNNR